MADSSAPISTPVLINTTGDAPVAVPVAPIAPVNVPAVTIAPVTITVAPTAPTAPIAPVTVAPTVPAFVPQIAPADPDAWLTQPYDTLLLHNNGLVRITVNDRDFWFNPLLLNVKGNSISVPRWWAVSVGIAIEPTA